MGGRVGSAWRLNPASLLGFSALVLAGSLAACGQKEPTQPAAVERVTFAHPLSTQLDDMMRSDAAVLVIGDPDFVSRIRSQEAQLGGPAYYLELPQIDLYALVALYPAIVKSKAKLIVMESIPAYWSGEVYFAAQPPAGPVKAAVDQVAETEPTPVAPAPEPGRAYVISPPKKPFNYSEAMKLVFDNYSGFWREIDDCALWVTNDDLLAAAPPAFQAAYKQKFSDPAVLNTNVGHVGSIAYAKPLLDQCTAAKAAAAAAPK